MTNIPADDQQHDRDLEHLRLLAIFYYIVGILTLGFACLGILHLAIGLGIALNPQEMKGNPPFSPILFGLMFAVAGAVFILAGWTLGVLTIYAGRCIQTRRRRFFVLVISGLNCPLYPFGTALGIAGFLILSRDSVKRLFES
jgi:hypothetical protein